MSAVPVRLEPPGNSRTSVDMFLATVPRVGELVLYKGREYPVERVIHVVSEHPAHVRVVLGGTP